MRTKKNIEISQFDNFYNKVQPLTEKFYNFLPKDELLSSLGIEMAHFPKNRTSQNEYFLDIESLNLTAVKGLTYFKQYFPTSGNTQHRLLLYGDDKKVYINQLFCSDRELSWLYELTFNSPPITLAYKKDDADAIILTSTDKMVVWKTNYAPYTIADVPIITSMSMNEGVLYCTIKEPAFKIWYATDLDAENVGTISQNSGFISLEDDLGYARKVITFDESVYVFRDYGITKITNYKHENSISQIYKSNTMIFCDTVSSCGNVILFMTKEGIYSFDGVKVKKMSIDLKNMLSGDIGKATASSLGNQYFVALKLDFQDSNEIFCELGDYVNNAMIVVNIVDELYQIIRGVDIQSFLPVKTDMFEKMLITFNSVNETDIGEICEDSKYFSNNLPKYWSSGMLAQGMNQKLFTSLKIKSVGDYQINIVFDDRTLTFSTYQDGVNEFHFKVCSKDCRVEILSNSQNVKVEKINLELYEY